VVDVFVDDLDLCALGTIRYWMGSTHFQMKMLKNAGTEISLHVLAYNMKRVINNRILSISDSGLI